MTRNLSNSSNSNSSNSNTTNTTDLTDINSQLTNVSYSSTNDIKSDQSTYISLLSTNNTTSAYLIDPTLLNSFVIGNNYINNKEIDFYNTDTTVEYGGFNFYKYIDPVTCIELLKIDGQRNLFAGSVNSDGDVNTTNNVNCLNVNTKSITLTTRLSNPNSEQIGYLDENNNGSTTLITTNSIQNAYSFTVGVGSWIINWYMIIIVQTAGSLNGMSIGTCSTSDDIDLRGSYRNSQAMAENNSISINGNLMISQTSESTLYINYNVNTLDTSTGSYIYKCWHQMMRVG
jgi:hypothetical protein